MAKVKNKSRVPRETYNYELHKGYLGGVVKTRVYTGITNDSERRTAENNRDSKDFDHIKVSADGSRELAENKETAAIDFPNMIEEGEIQEFINSLAIDYNRYDRFEAAYALISYGAKSVGPLIDALKIDNWKIRGNAAWTLGKIGDSRAVKPLIDALCDEVPEVRATAGQAILNIGKSAIVSLSESLNSSKPKNKGIISCLLAALSSEQD